MAMKVRVEVCVSATISCCRCFFATWRTASSVTQLSAAIITTKESTSFVRSRRLDVLSGISVIVRERPGWFACPFWRWIPHTQVSCPGHLYQWPARTFAQVLSIYRSLFALRYPVDLDV